MSQADMNCHASVDAYLALGSNLGDREATIQSAIRALDSVPYVQVIQTSSMHETDPVGPPGQNRYINAALKVRTNLCATDLLKACLEIERVHGRVRVEQDRWKARTLDIDLLLYGEHVIDDAGPPRLLVPHSRLAERMFVLDPLAEIAPHVLHPVHLKPIARLRDDLKQSEYRQRQACSYQ